MAMLCHGLELVCIYRHLDLKESSNFYAILRWFCSLKSESICKYPTLGSGSAERTTRYYSVKLHFTMPMCSRLGASQRCSYFVIVVGTKAKATYLSATIYIYIFFNFLIFIFIFERQRETA